MKMSGRKELEIFYNKSVHITGLPYKPFHQGFHFRHYRIIFQSILSCHLPEAEKRQPGTSVFILPYGNTQRQFNRNTLINLHQACSYLGRTEYKYCCRAQVQAGFLCIAGMIKLCEKGDLPLPESLFQARNGIRSGQFPIQ